MRYLKISKVCDLTSSGPLNGYTYVLLSRDSRSKHHMSLLIMPRNEDGEVVWGQRAISNIVSMCVGSPSDSPTLKGCLDTILGRLDEAETLVACNTVADALSLICFWEGDTVESLLLKDPQSEELENLLKFLEDL